MIILSDYQELFEVVHKHKLKTIRSYGIKWSYRNTQINGILKRKRRKEKWKITEKKQYIKNLVHRRMEDTCKLKWRSKIQHCAHLLFLCRPSNIALYLCFNGNFPGKPGLAGVHWSTDVVVTTGAIGLSRAKLQSNHHQQTNTHFFLQAGCPSCLPTNRVKALKRKYHILLTCLPQSHLGVSRLCLWPLIYPGYLGEGCQLAMPLTNISL